MGLLLAEAAKLELPYLVAGVAEEIVTVDELFNFIPFKNIAPVVTHEYNRELSLGSQDAAWIDPNGTLTESAPTFTQVSDTVKVLAAAVNVPKLFLSNPVQAAVSIAKKSKQIARAFSKTFITGSGGTGIDVEGLEQWVGGVGTSQNITGSSSTSSALSFTLMDQGFDAVLVGNPNAIVMPNRTREAYFTLLRAAGGIQPQMVQVPNINSPYFTVGFRGVPVLRNDWIPVDKTSVGGGTALTNVYFCYFNENDGLTAFYNGSTILDISDPIPVPSSDSIQFVVAMRVGVSLMSTLALSTISYISN